MNGLSALLSCLRPHELEELDSLLFAPSAEGISDWRTRVTTLFPAYVTHGFAPHHEEMWEWAARVQVDSTPDPFIAIWARGGGKSTSAELVTTDLGVSGRRRYALYVRETQEQADKSVGNIASLLESDSVAAYYPAHADKDVGKHGNSRGWRRNRLRTAGGFTVDALGLDTATRGVKVDEQRPDLIVLDDIDGKHDTVATTLKKIESITTSILPAGSSNVAVLAIQNLLIPDGFFTRLADGRADYLARRIVSGPHKALVGLEWEYREQADGTRRAVIQVGVPTWSGQDVAKCQHQIDTWGISAFLKEAQHEVTDRSDSLALNFDHARHLETLTDEQARAIVGMGQVFGGGDFGRWRFAFNLWAADRDGKVHQIAEYFSQQEDLEHRARVIHAICTHYGAIHERDERKPQENVQRLRIWGDSANPTDIAEINAAFKRISSPLRFVAVGRDGKLRAAAVERINDQLGRTALLLRRDVMDYVAPAVREQWKALGYPGSAPDLRLWMLGMNAGNAGVQMVGSRLLWEVEHWSYPVPKPGEAQTQDPDDHTADGADLIAATRYALMSFWKAAKPEEVVEKPDRNVDRGLEKLLERAQDEQRRMRGEGLGLQRRR